MIYWPVTTLYIIIVWLIFPEANTLPSLEKSIENTKDGEHKFLIYLPVFQFHNFIVVSLLPEANNLPSLEKQIEFTPPECPSKLFIYFPLPTLHNLILR